jgi:hypothetical protein
VRSGTIASSLSRAAGAPVVIRIRLSRVPDSGNSTGAGQSRQFSEQCGRLGVLPGYWPQLAVNSMVST